MPSINRSHDDLAFIASGLRQVLLGDELLGLISAQYEIDISITPLSLDIRQALAELAGDLEAVAQEHTPAENSAENELGPEMVSAQLMASLMIESGRRALADGIDFSTWLDHVSNLVKEYQP